MQECQWEQIKELFGEAVELSVADREVYLQRTCHDSATRYKVIELLQNFDALPPDYLLPPSESSY